VAQIVEVVSDVVCPWCFIGKRRLEKALALLDRPDIQVHWKPFELNPNMPKEGMDRGAYRTRKFGSPEYARQLEAGVVSAGAEEGIGFRFDRVARVPNTFDAHRLIWLAGRHGVQDAVVESLFRAYFIDAEDAGDAAVLRRIADAAGLAFDDETGSVEVRAEEAQARARAIDGVPAFLVDGVPVVSGAQHAELLASVLGRAFEVCSLEDDNCP
jgi:predicted DsbA family dithiol-disulfide isomerase